MPPMNNDLFVLIHARSVDSPVKSFVVRYAYFPGLVTSSLCTADVTAVRGVKK